MSIATRGAIRWRWVLAVGALALILLIASSQTCLRTGFGYGLWLDECPDGDLKQTISVNAPALTRGGASSVTVSVSAHYTTGPADTRSVAPVSRFAPTLMLVTPAGETALLPKKSWERTGDSLTAEIELPKVNDGDYTLRTRVTSSIGDSSLDLPLPLYTPARVHVLTDRPLFEPGNTVKFRALALKASDLSPLEERPGTWRVIDPSGETLLEEKAPSGPWGVVAGSFPLDQGAQSGTWTVTWTSGGAVGSRTFEVKPFTLPRFRVEASAMRPYYRRNERPVLKGTVKYSSGAPVANAKLELVWNVSGGEWPPPTSWVEGTALPKSATTSASGGFTVELPAVPEDLQGQATMFVDIGAVDAAGDRVEGSASVLLSQDPIAVSAVTELAEGIVEGFNNRLYLRATTADGRLLEGVTLNVKRLWEPTDKGTDAVVDEDGVASLQVDPGPPVNVIIPAMPFRPPPREKLVQRSSLSERLAEGSEDDDGDVRLADRLAFDRIEAKLEPCARYIHSSGETALAGLLVRASGAVSASALPGGKLGKCMADAIGALRFEPGKERFFEASWTFNDDDLPGFDVSADGIPGMPGELNELLADALLDARDCLPPTVRSGSLPRMIHWKVGEDRRKVELSWVPVRGDAYYSDAALACIQSRVTSLTLPKHPEGEEYDEGEPAGAMIGVAHVSVHAPEKYEAERPQETILVGYEFLITAKKGNEVFGSTRLRMRPGAVPPIRLRATKQLVRAGEDVKVEILRGPDFTGELPEKLFLRHAYETVEAKVDEKSRSAQFKVPGDWQGWANVEWNGGQVFFFVEDPTPLAVKLTPEKERYTPGQVAQLGVETTIAGKGGRAGVGLFGVDDSLGQLVSLPGADELASLRSQATAIAAFGGLDAQALTLGRIRGANAAAATLLRVSALPPPPEREAAVALNGSTVFDPNEALVDRFYVVLGELYTQVREWEGGAPANEKMTPPVMAGLWSKSLDAVERRKESARDAWGRKLRLHRLPMDLLALTDPRTVVINATRLPEDIQNWSQWVAKEKP